MRIAGRLALGLGAVNLFTLVLIAAVSAEDGSWAKRNKLPPAHAIPVSEVAWRAEQSGLDRIVRIETDGTSYQVQGLDDSGRRVELRVDPFTGTVTR